MPNVDPYVEKITNAIGKWDNERNTTALLMSVRQALVDAADHSAAQREQIVEGLLASDRNIEVSRCSDCPHCFYTGGECCLLPLNNNDIESHKAPPPKCPLRVQPTRIVLVEGV